MQYLVRRLALAVPTVLLVMILVFLLIRIVPGDVVTLLLADQNVSEEQAERLREDLGLNDPLAVQFGRFLADTARGDLGESIWSGRPVAGDLWDRLPITLELALLASLFSLAIGLVGGTAAAVFHDRWPDHVIRAGAVGGLAVPGFWIGTLAIVMPAIWWGYSPPLRHVSFFDDPWANLRQYGVPALIMSLYFGAILLKMTRSSMLEVLSHDFVRTARAKGLRNSTVLIRHCLKNALLPVITIFGTQFAVMLGGSVIFESIFNLKGVGTYLFQAVGQKDYPVIQGVNIVLALAVVFVNMLVDLSYSWLDPRIREA